MEAVKSIKLTSSGIAYTGECLLTGMLLGMDKVNDPSITIYDGTDATGDEVVPTNDYDASALGLNGYMASKPDHCKTGIYVDITCAGTVEVVIKYQPRTLWGVG